MSDTDKVRGSDIIGRRIDLSDNRLVFIGVHPKYPNETGIAFRNSSNSYTTFRLSPEAVEALRELLNNSEAGTHGPLPSPPFVLQWQLMEPKT